MAPAVDLLRHVDGQIVKPDRLPAAPNLKIESRRVRCHIERRHAERKRQILIGVNCVTIDRSDHIARLHTRRLKRRAFGKFCDLRGGVNTVLPAQDHHQQDREQDIHDAARCDDDDPLPDRPVAERVRIVAFLVLALHRAVTADGKKPQRILRLPAREREQLRSHADREFIDAHAAELRRKEMTELVDENNQPEKQNADDNQKR